MAKQPAKKSTVRKTTKAKKVAPKKTTGMQMGSRRTAVKKAAVKKTAPRKGAGKKVAAKKAPMKVARKKTTTKKGPVDRRSSERNAVKAPPAKMPRPTKAPSRDVERAMARQASPFPWPDAVNAGNDVHVDIGIAPRRPDPRAQLHLVQGSPNELHPGTTRKTGKSHDRPGSQLERKRHQYPGSNVPNRGSAHTAQVKGKRRNDRPQGEE